LTLPRLGVPEVNPFKTLPKRHLKEVKRRRFLTPIEYQRLERALLEEWHRVVLEAFVYTGFRHREMRMFRQCWIQWDRGEFGQIQLPEEYAKNDEPRIIPMFPRLRDTLKNWCARQSSEFVFAHWSHSEQEWLPYTSFQGFWTGACRRAGVEDVRIHDLRHTFASWWVQKGGHMAALKELLGHADMRMVDRYAHLNTEAQHREVGRIHDLL
jgi:integrase/recombinase XerD